MSDESSLRTHVLSQLQSEGAHRGFSAVTSGLPASVRGTRPSELPYSPWELVEHMRLAQADILDFWQNAHYQQPQWPDDYWPASGGPPDEARWEESLQTFSSDLEAIQRLVRTTDDLQAEIPHGDGQTYLREALLVADHNSYHLGQLVTVRRLLGVWPF